MGNNSPQLLRPDVNQGEELVRLAQENAALLRQAEARALRVFADSAVSSRVHEIATKAVLLKLGITEQEWQQSIDAARSSLPEVPQHFDSLGAIAAFLQELAEQ
jgi:hypothetical protein